ncbi:MAG: YtxH domain-containing protein [Calditrichaeota bacterium]|nr:YtxH domain-containing protein [Calditrichota bacterium]
MASKEQGYSFFTGLMLGGAVAATFALLYAPKSGKKLRKDIRKKSGNLLNEAESRYKELQDMAEDVLSDTEKRINMMKKNADTAIDDIMKKVKDIHS